MPDKETLKIENGGGDTMRHKEISLYGFDLVALAEPHALVVRRESTGAQTPNRM